MASNGFRWSFDLDSNPAKKGADEVARAIEDAGEVFEDFARDADRSVEKVGDSLGDDVKKGAREAEDAVERLERQIKEATDAAQKSGKSGRDMGDDFKRGAKEADEGLDTLNENAASNAKEIGASFDGTFEGLADGVQGFIAEATEGFGAVGLVAGVGLATAIGIGLSALTDAAEEANVLTENAAALTDELANAGTTEEKISVLTDRFSELANEIGDARSAWEIWQPRAITKAEQFADAIKQGSLSAADLEDAFKNPDPIARLEDLRDVASQVQTSIDRYNRSLEDNRTLNTRVGPAQQEVNQALQENIRISEAARDIIQDEIATQEASNAILEAKATALGLTTDQYLEHIAATDAATAAQDAYASALESTSEPVSVYEGILAQKQEAEEAAAEASAKAAGDTSGAWRDSVPEVSASVDEMIAEWNRQAEEAAAFEGNLAIIAASGGQALADELRAQGPEAAAATADLIAKSGDAKIREASEAYGKANGEKVGEGTATGIRSKQGAVQGAVDDVAKGIRTPSLGYPVHVDQNELQDEADKAARSVRPPIIQARMTVGVERAV